MLNIALDIARGLAALWVFLYHLRLGLEPGLLRQFADQGMLGVPAFFVISGYCMMASSRSTLAKGHTALSFLKRRLRRIYPPLWASIAVTMAVPFALAAVIGWWNGKVYWPTPRWLEYGPGDWLAMLTLTKGLAWVGPAHKPWAAVNAVYWSLAIEVQFYLLMALGVWLRRGFGALMLGLTAGSIAWHFSGNVLPGLFMHYWPMFSLGFLLFLVLEKGWRPARLFGRWSAVGSIASFAAVMTGALYVTLRWPSVTLERQTLFAVFCFLAMWAAAGIEAAIPKDAWATRPFVGLGKMSYSTYLMHVPLIPVFHGAVTWLLKGHNTAMHFGYILATLPLLYLFYLVFEKPFAGGAGKKKPQAKPMPAVTPVEEPVPVLEVVSGQ